MKVRITIRGRSYTVRSDQADDDVHAIARYVDAQLAQIAQRSAADEYTVAILAALNIASEFDRFRRQVDRELESLDRDLASTAVVVESGLPGGQR